MLVGGVNSEKGEVGCEEREGFSGKNVEEVSCHTKGSGQKRGGTLAWNSRERTTLFMVRIMCSALSF
jgi:hypothetical protein